MAVPRVVMPGSRSGVPLPEPLAPSDAALVRRIFKDQAIGRMKEAERDTAALANPLLLGSILADRYLGRFHHSTVSELRAWLRDYADQPEAPAIRALLVKRLPRGAAPPPPLHLACLAPEQLSDPVPEDVDPSTAHIRLNPWLVRVIARDLDRDAYTAALRLISRQRRVPPQEAALLRTRVARALFAANRDSEAERVGNAASRATPASERIGNPAYVAALAAWRQGHLQTARSLFTRAARAPEAAPSLQAAASYWAARAALDQHQPNLALEWLKRAAKQKRTFYGLIARRMLGWSAGLILSRDTLSEADIAALGSTPQGLRAFALLEVGQDERAEEELRCLWPEVKDNRPLRHALVLVAASTRLSGLAVQLAGLEQIADGIPRDALRFPVPRLRPIGGFKVDPALVYGVARTESNFNPHAVSPAGARGLMQIMPRAARAITHDWHLAAYRLHDPGFNLEIGQRWIRFLATRAPVDNDLVGLLASYNAGLASYARWSPDVRDKHDPLLFIEAIPIPQTRLFVQRALAYTWIYAARLGLPAPSLDAIAAGTFPRFTSEPPGTTLLISAHPGR